LVPTMVKLIDMINPTLADGSQDSRKEPLAEESAVEELEPIEEDPGPSIPSVPLLPEPPVNQFMVENLRSLGDFLGSGDTVRIDSTTIMQWKELVGDLEIEEVVVKTFDGKMARCRFKSIKGSDYDGKGVIQMPEKIQAILQIKKGDLVTVQPVIERAPDQNSGKDRQRRADDS
jgi:hypothetical protein